MTGRLGREAAARRRCIVVLTMLATLVVFDAVVRHGDADLRAYYVNRFDRKLPVIDALPDRPEIVLFGSSRADYGLVPDEFRAATRRRVFNLSIPGTKLVEWRIVAQRTFDSWKPSLVVLGINGSEVRADYLPVPGARDLFSVGDFVEYCRSDGWSNEIAGHYARRLIGGGWAAWGRRFELRCWFDERLGAVMPKYAQHARERRELVSIPCPSDGYVHPWQGARPEPSLQARIDANGERGVNTAGMPEYASDATSLRHLEELFEWFQDRRIAVVVAYIPNSPLTESRWANVEPRLEREIIAVCDRASVPYLSCTNEEFPRSNDDYYDETHMGLELARRLSRRIAGHIVERGLMQPSETRYAQSLD